MSAPRLATVDTAPGAVLVATWRDGHTDRIVLSGWLEAGHPHFHRLREPAVFARAAVVDHGLTVEWDGDEHLAIDTLHLSLLAQQQAPFGPADIADWQRRHAVSNQEAADLLGVSVNTWLNYRNGTTRTPQSVAIACRAMDRDHLVFSALYRPRAAGRPPAAAG